MHLKIEEINCGSDLEHLRAEWQNLYETCPSATPFQSPDWLIPWWNHLGSGELLVLAARSDGGLAGLAPLYVCNNGDLRSELLFLGTGISDHLDFICKPELAGEATSRFLEHLWNLPDRWDTASLQELRQESPLLEALSSMTGHAVLSEIGVCPVVALPRTIESYMDSLGANLRRSLRTTGKKLAPFSVDQAAPEDVPEFMESLFLLHRRRWTRRNLPGVLDRPEIQAFHREAAASFAARRSLGLYALRHRGIVAAMLYGMRKKPRFYAYLSGFDPSLDELSPGALLICSVIEDAIRSEFREFDFLRGAERYKYVWGARDNANYQLTLDRR